MRLRRSCRRSASCVVERRRNPGKSSAHLVHKKSLFSPRNAEEHNLVTNDARATWQRASDAGATPITRGEPVTFSHRRVA